MQGLRFQRASLASIESEPLQAIRTEVPLPAATAGSREPHQA